MDATEGMRKAIAERKKLTDEKVKIVREVRLTPETIRQEHRVEQRRTE